MSENAPEKTVEEEAIESVHECFFLGDISPKPNSSNSGGLIGDESWGEPSSAGLVRFEECIDASEPSFSSISSN